MDASVTTTTAPAVRRDPVCGMDLTADQIFVVRQVGNDLVYFCSPACLHQFEWGSGLVVPRLDPARRSNAALPSA